MKIATRGAITLCALVGLSLVVPSPHAGARTYSLMTPSAVSTRTLGQGAWCWFNDPRALAVGSQTITGWVSTDGSIMAASYDRATGVSETYNLHPQLQYDDHANPSFYRRQDGRITAFYSKHAGSPLYYRTTTGGSQISEWGPEHTVGTNTAGKYGVTYPNPVWSSPENKLYLFWRGGNFLPTYSTSSDEGETWAPAKTLIDDNEPYANMRPYVKYAERNGVIHVAFTQAHPRDRVTSIFYLKYVPGAGWQRANGTDIGAPPFIHTDGDRVYNAWDYGMRSWVHDIAVGADGYPRIVFATFSRSADYQDHRYWYARWDGTKWLKWQIVRAGPSIAPGTEEKMYSAGITLDQEDPDIVYLSRKAPDWSVFKTEVWKTSDGGASWAITPVARGIRPISPRRQTDTSVVQVLYMVGHYGYYSTYQTEVRISDVTTTEATPATALRKR